MKRFFRAFCAGILALVPIVAQAQQPMLTEKNSKVINAVGEEISRKYGIEWIHSDFKKKDGYLHSTRLAKEYNLYRQKFCGCEFAWRGPSE